MTVKAEQHKGFEVRGYELEGYIGPSATQRKGRSKLERFRFSIQRDYSILPVHCFERW